MRTITPEVAVHARPEHGEGPVWLEEERCLVWVDIPRRAVHRFRPDTGEDTATDVGQPVGAAVPRACGGLVLALESGFAALDDGGAVEMLAPVGEDDPGIRFNDGKCDPAGRFLAGTMAYDFAEGAAALYRLDPDRSVTTLLTGVTISNGLAWSADGTTLYYIDSPTQRVDAFDYDVDAGTLANRRPVIEIPAEAGLPDGMTIDAEGCLWVALFSGGAVRRYTPDGRLDAVVQLPVSQVTSCAFGGDGHRQLYITTSTEQLSAQDLVDQPYAGAVFVCEPGVVGMPASAYAG